MMPFVAHPAKPVPVFNAPAQARVRRAFLGLQIILALLATCALQSAWSQNTEAPSATPAAATPAAPAAVPPALPAPTAPATPPAESAELLDASANLAGTMPMKGKRFYVSEYRLLVEVGGQVTANTRAAYFGGADEWTITLT